ncbi:MAG: hypothetical protein ACYDG2_23380 [Ruminiclostridium sp.]
MKQERKFILMNKEEFKAYIEGQKNVKEVTNIQQHLTASPCYKYIKNNHTALMNMSLKKHTLFQRGRS